MQIRSGAKRFDLRELNIKNGAILARMRLFLHVSHTRPFFFKVRFMQQISFFSRALATMVPKRGMFIVFEGNDRVGKSTQAKKLAEWFVTQGKRSEFISFPDRSTATGALIDQYLKREQKMCDQMIHLLFTTNRWEKFENMRQSLESGTNLVVDRYSFSGVAYSAAKPNIDFEWCKGPESGLLKPDCVIFLSHNVNLLEERQNYGDEIYDDNDFQERVKNVYSKLKDDTWSVSLQIFVAQTLNLFCVFSGCGCWRQYRASTPGNCPNYQQQVRLFRFKN